MSQVVRSSPCHFAFILMINRSKSWRFGFQIMALVVSLCFFLGVLYRPASLYHPQRRAILHLKSLQKKSRLKDQHLKNAMNTAPTQVQSEGGGGSTVMSTSKTTQKIPSEKPAYFDFTVLKSKTVQIIMSGTCIAHFGMTAPPFLLVSCIRELYSTPITVCEHMKVVRPQIKQTKRSSLVSESDLYDTVI